MGFCERPRYGTALLLFRCGEGVGEKNGFDEKSGFCLVRMSWRPPRLEIYLGGGREKAGWRRRQNLVGRSARAKIFQRDPTVHSAIVCCSLAVLVTVRRQCPQSPATHTGCLSIHQPRGGAHTCLFIRSGSLVHERKKRVIQQGPSFAGAPLFSFASRVLCVQTGKHDLCVFATPYD